MLLRSFGSCLYLIWRTIFGIISFQNWLWMLYEWSVHWENNHNTLFFLACVRTMSSDLEKAMLTIVQIFHKYSGHKCKLKKADLKHLINNEMSQFIMVSVWDQPYELVRVRVSETHCERTESPVIQISAIFQLWFMDNDFLLSNYASKVWGSICLRGRAFLSKMLRPKYEKKNKTPVSLFCKTK